MSRTEKIAVLAAGGTGGHLFPAQALAEQLGRQGVRLSLITDKRATEISGALADADIYRISASGVSGRNIIRRLFAIFGLCFGFIQAILFLRTIKPDVVVGFGSYASFPTVAAATLLGYRTVIHEQNAILGRANRLLAPRVTRIATAFEFVSNLKAKDRRKMVWTGNPVRPNIVAISDKPYPKFGQNSNINILIFGGSQGATIFSNIVPKALMLLPQEIMIRIRVVQQCRDEDVTRVQKIYRQANIEAIVEPFFNDIATHISWSHLVICRAGASTLAELAAAGRPAILVPFPHAIDDHQTRNAQGLCDAGGGWMIAQDALTAGALASRLEALCSIEHTLAMAAECATKIGVSSAAERLSSLVMETLDPNQISRTGKRSAI